MGKYGTPALVRSHIHLLQAVPWPFPSQTSFHTGSISRDSVPLWQVRLAAALPAGVSGTDSSSGPIPHWQRFPRFVSQQPFRQASLVRIPHPVHFHTGSISRDSVPLRQVRLAAALPAGVSGTDSSSGPIPHWQRFPRFGGDSVLLWKKRHGKNLKELFRKTASK